MHYECICDISSCKILKKLPLKSSAVWKWSSNKIKVWSRTGYLLSEIFNVIPLIGYRTVSLEKYVRLLCIFSLISKCFRTSIMKRDMRQYQCIKLLIFVKCVFKNAAKGVTKVYKVEPTTLKRLSFFWKAVATFSKNLILENQWFLQKGIYGTFSSSKSPRKLWSLWGAKVAQQLSAQPNWEAIFTFFAILFHDTI